LEQIFLLFLVKQLFFIIFSVLWITLEKIQNINSIEKKISYEYYLQLILTEFLTIPNELIAFAVLINLIAFDDMKNTVTR